MKWTFLTFIILAIFIIYALSTSGTNWETYDITIIYADDTQEHVREYLPYPPEIKAGCIIWYNTDTHGDFTYSCNVKKGTYRIVNKENEVIG